MNKQIPWADLMMGILKALPFHKKNNFKIYFFSFKLFLEYQDLVLRRQISFSIFSSCKFRKHRSIASFQHQFIDFKLGQIGIFTIVLLFLFIFY